MVWAFSLILLILALLLMPLVKRKFQLYHWKKAYNLKQHAAMLEEISQGIDGFQLSHQARLHQDAMEYTYGEIDFLSFVALISLTQPTENTQFYDLGSGTGKAVFACAMVFDMKRYCGVELFESLHQASLLQLERLRQQAPYVAKANKISFIHDNFLNVDLSPASLIFINSTAFFGETWEKLNEKLLQQLQRGTVIITTSKPLSNHVYSVSTARVKMSWGFVTAYIHHYHPSLSA